VYQSKCQPARERRKLLRANPIFRMSDEIAFLLDTAEELRHIALGAPEIGNELRRLADELEARAAKLSRRLRRTGG